jgi:hypothetical protein
LEKKIGFRVKEGRDEEPKRTCTTTTGASPTAADKCLAQAKRVKVETKREQSDLIAIDQHLLVWNNPYTAALLFAFHLLRWEFVAPVLHLIRETHMFAVFSPP